jgi:hypothetical protein
MTSKRAFKFEQEVNIHLELPAVRTEAAMKKRKNGTDTTLNSSRAFYLRPMLEFFEHQGFQYDLSRKVAVFFTPPGESDVNLERKPT